MPINNIPGLRVALYGLVPAGCCVGASLVVHEKVFNLLDVVADVSQAPLFVQTVRYVQDVGKDLVPTLEITLSRFSTAVGDGLAMGQNGYREALSMLPIVENILITLASKQLAGEALALTQDLVTSLTAVVLKAFEAAAVLYQVSHAVYALFMYAMPGLLPLVNVVAAWPRSVYGPVLIAGILGYSLFIIGLFFVRVVKKCL